MSDRPNLSEILDAVRMHLETALLPVIRPEPRLYFQTLVALNMLKIAQREISSGAQMMRLEWEGVNQLTDDTQPAPDRDGELAEALKNRYRALRQDIRQGVYDAREPSLHLAAFLEAVVTAQLIMNNPGLARRIGGEISEGNYAE